eukprot:364040-Chlamydomonas_euryale.AAC.7
MRGLSAGARAPDSGSVWGTNCGVRETREALYHAVGPISSRRPAFCRPCLARTTRANYGPPAAASMP